MTNTIKTVKDFPIFRTVIIGEGPKNSVDAFTALKRARVNISHRATAMLKNTKFIFSKEKKEIKLTYVQAKDLGFKEGVTLKVLYERAITLGLVLVPAEVAVHFLLQEKESKNVGGNLAMELLRAVSFDNSPCVFTMSIFTEEPFTGDKRQVYLGADYDVEEKKHKDAGWIFIVE